MPRNKIKTKHCFTLMEILVVIAIIGILAQIVLTALSSAREKALIAKAQTDINHIRLAILQLQVDCEEWPNHEAVGFVNIGAPGNEIWDLTLPEAGLLSNDPVQPYNNWKGPYIDSIPQDPWGNDYFFDTDYDRSYGAGTDWVAAIGSFGPNGQGAGNPAYEADDVLKVLTE